VVREFQIWEFNFEIWGLEFWEQREKKRSEKSEMVSAEGRRQNEGGINRNSGEVHASRRADKQQHSRDSDIVQRNKASRGKAQQSRAE
jgi:hypothetical protein